MLFNLTRNDISPRLTNLASMGHNPLPVMRAMGNTFKSITEGNFNSVGARFRPTPWAPLHNGNPSILQRSTTMAKAFHLDVGPHHARLSNPTKYAATHQFGATIHPKGKKVLKYRRYDGRWRSAKSVTIPPRPFYPVINGKLTQPAEDLIAKAADRVIQRQAGGK